MNNADEEQEYLLVLSFDDIDLPVGHDQDEAQHQLLPRMPNRRGQEQELSDSAVTLISGLRVFLITIVAVAIMWAFGDFSTKSVEEIAVILILTPIIAMIQLRYFRP